MFLSSACDRLASCNGRNAGAQKVAGSAFRGADLLEELLILLFAQNGELVGYRNHRAWGQWWWPYACWGCPGKPEASPPPPSPALSMAFIAAISAA